MIMEDSYCLIMVGGSGKRLWPLSTKERPKPFLPLVTNKPLIEETVERIIDIFPKERIRFVLQKAHKELALEIFPWTNNENYYLEPEGRDTAACICLALLSLPKNSNVIVLSSDHYISDKSIFQKSLIAGISFLKENPDFILTFGIPPKRPETCYGYIEKGKELEKIEGIKISKVARFVEKPDIERAKSFIKSKRYFWNSGIFIFKKERMEGLFSTYLPEHLKVIKGGNKEAFKKLKKVSIDSGIMEHVKTIGMIEGDFLWDDIGGYESLSRIHKKDKNGNRIFGNHKGIDTKDCIIYSKDAKIKTIGIRGLVIAHSKEGILVAKRKRANEIKELIE